MDRTIIENVQKDVDYITGEGEKCKLRLIKAFRNGEASSLRLYFDGNSIDLGYDHIIEDGGETLAVRLAKALSEIDVAMPSKIETKSDPCKPTTFTTLQWKPIQGCYPGDANRIEAECSLGTWVITYEPASKVYHLMKSMIYSLSPAYQAAQVFFKEQEAITFCEDFTKRHTRVEI